MVGVSASKEVRRLQRGPARARARQLQGYTCHFRIDCLTEGLPALLALSVMIDPFTKLPGHKKAPPGLERKILRLIPKVFVTGTVMIFMPSLITRLWNLHETPWVVAKLITTVDIYAFSLLSVLWTTLFTVGVGALTVMVMKGPAYVADAYPLPDADKPRSIDESEDKAPR